MTPPANKQAAERLALRNRFRVSDFRDHPLPELPDVPGMITVAERHYYHWLTSRGYAGAGAVVEVGTWLGRSTIHLGAGLREAGFDDALHCFDRYRWEELHGTRTDLALRPGDSFQSVFEANVRPVYPRVRVTSSDVRDATWTGGPIEILVLDAPKRLPEISAVAASFFPHLSPGASLVVLQDYLHFPSYPLAAWAGLLREQLELVHLVEGSCCASFRVIAPLAFGEAQPVDWNLLAWSPQRAREHWNRVLAPLSPGARDRLESGIAMWLYDLGSEHEAVEALTSLELSPRTLRSWQKFAASSLSTRYRPLFRALGLEPSREQQRKASYRRVRQVYLGARRRGRRLLESAGLLAPRGPLA